MSMQTTKTFSRCGCAVCVAAFTECSTKQQEMELALREDDEAAALP